MRNEEASIGRCLDSLIRQEYPSDRLEIVVADGASEDTTRDIVRQKAAAAAVAIRLLENPDRLTPYGLNQGISAARGSYVMIMSGHAEAQLDTVRTAVSKLQHEGLRVAGVGGRIRPVSSTYVGRVISAVRTTPLGCGLSPYRYATRARYVETIAYGIYRREIFDRVGAFDVNLTRNQDNELNARIVRAGYRLIFTPEIVVTYHSRSSLHSTARQLYQYGWWKPAEYSKDWANFRIVDLVPLAFVLGLPLVLALPRWVPALASLRTAVLTAYMTIVLVDIVMVGRRDGWSLTPLVPLVLLTVHTSIGIGELVGAASTLLLAKGSIRQHSSTSDQAQ